MSDEAVGTKAVVVETAEAVAVVKCRICGKPLTDPDSVLKGIGPECESKGYTPEAIAARKAELSGEAVPEGWIKIGDACNQLQAMGIPHTRLVRAVGGDRGMGEPLNEDFRPMYVGRQRWLNPNCISGDNLEKLKGLGRAPAAPKEPKPKKEKAAKAPADPNAPAPTKKAKAAKTPAQDPEEFYRQQLEEASKA